MKNNKGNALITAIGIIFLLILFFSMFSSDNTNDYPQYVKDDYSTSTPSTTYTNSHKCEYPGCSNYASKTKYCSKHNQTKCSRAGCNNIEAYQGAGLCREHLYQSIKNY